MNVNPAPAAYSQRDEATFRLQVEQADDDNLKRGRDIIIPYAERFVLTSADGSQFALAVSNAGVLSTVAYP